MAYAWPNYDPTVEALLHPELSHPHGLHKKGDGWSLEAICAEFSRLAYFKFKEEEKKPSAAGFAELSQALAEAGFGIPVTFNSDVPPFGNWLRRLRQGLRRRGSQAFAATSLDGELTLLAFRGTQADDIRDLLTDIMTWSVRFPAGGRVHAGFWAAYSSLHDKISEWLADNPPKRLVVTGHSLGAAMATLMAAVREEAELVTFGCPLVGNREFADRFGRKALRYVDCTDMVTTVPYGWLGYVHFGELRYVDREGTVRLPAPSEEEMKEDRKSARGHYRRSYAGIKGNVPVRDFADHAPVNYVSAVAGKRP
jgi:hypothetical protein